MKKKKLAFVLSMPGCSSWNGRWTGEGKKYAIIKTLGEDRAQQIIKEGYYTYRWNDGWCAGISVSEVIPQQAAKLKKETQGFCGYEWMVSSIIQHNDIRVSAKS